ncbi:hypothetical protein DYB28_004202, partial [Aphanomyces astaci]
MKINEHNYRDCKTYFQSCLMAKGILNQLTARLTNLSDLDDQKAFGILLETTEAGQYHMTTTSTNPLITAAAASMVADQHDAFEDATMSDTVMDEAYTTNDGVHAAIKHRIIGDSGASTHMTDTATHLYETRDCHRQNIVANGGVTVATTIGKLNITTPTSKVLTYLNGRVVDRRHGDHSHTTIEIVGQPATKWTPTKSDMQTYCRALSVDPHGDVTSRLVSFMKRVDDVIDGNGNGLRQQLKDWTKLRTASANDLVAFADILREQLNRTHDADMVKQQRNSYSSKRDREEDDQERRITKHAKKANQAVRDQREFLGNYP